MTTLSPLRALVIPAYGVPGPTAEVSRIPGFYAAAANRPWAPADRPVRAAA